MLAFIFQVMKIVGIPAICYICYLGAKLITINIISKHPEWSDDKVKHITRMMAKDKAK